MVSNTLKISEKQALKYPKSIGFIISNEFCERFNFYGMRTILVLYLTIKLGYSNDTATILFHVFTSLVYFFPLIGAIVADSWLGRFKTIFYLSVVYCIGSVIISLGAIPPLNMPTGLSTIVGLVLIAIGTGGIKPCVSAFGGDQFKLPEQAKQLATFFSLFYFAINAGSLISTSITPILREDVHCFDENHCFSLAFGVPGILMIVAIIIFVAGKNMYVIKERSGNMVVLVFWCVVEALRNRIQKGRSALKQHWLDYAVDKYGEKLVHDTKCLFKILVLYLPLPFFWALFDQQGSRWTFQATRMIGRIGSFNIKPDQMQVVNPLLILLFIPLFDYAVYPLLKKIGIKRPLQKLTVGGLLAAAAFGLSGFIEMNLEAELPVVPGPEMGQLRIYNPLPCDYIFETTIPKHESIILNRLNIFVEEKYTLKREEVFEYNATSRDAERCPALSGTIKIQPNTALSYLIKQQNGSETYLHEFKDAPQKPDSIFPYVRVLASMEENSHLLMKGEISDQDLNTNKVSVEEVPEGGYELYLGTHHLGQAEFLIGGTYVLLISPNQTSGYHFKNIVLIKPNSIHILWQLPQYIVITAGEVMFSVTGLEFSFTQAPLSMKSVLQACWLLTVAIGNLIVVAIAKVKLFESQAIEFFIFAILMIIDMLVFIILAVRYKYVEPVSDSDVDLNNTPKGEENKAYVED